MLGVAISLVARRLHQLLPDGVVSAKLFPHERAALAALQSGDRVEVTALVEIDQMQSAGYREAGGVTLVAQPLVSLRLLERPG